MAFTGYVTVEPASYPTYVFHKTSTEMCGIIADAILQNYSNFEDTYLLDDPDLADDTYYKLLHVSKRQSIQKNVISLLVDLYNSEVYNRLKIRAVHSFLKPCRKYSKKVFEKYTLSLRIGDPMRVSEEIDAFVMCGTLVQVPRRRKDNRRRFLSHDMISTEFSLRGYFEEIFGMQCRVFFQFPRRGFSVFPMSARCIQIYTNPSRRVTPLLPCTCVMLCSIYRITLKERTKRYPKMLWITVSCYATLGL